MYNHIKAQQSKNRVHISWDILYISVQYNIPTIHLFPATSRWKCVLERIMGLCWGGISEGHSSYMRLVRHCEKKTCWKAWWLEWMSTGIVYYNKRFVNVIWYVCFILFQQLYSINLIGPFHWIRTKFSKMLHWMEILSTNCHLPPTTNISM